MLVIDRTDLVHQQMPQLVHERERLPGLPGLFLNDDHRADRIIKSETQNWIFLGNLPFPVVAIAAKHQYASRFHRRAIGFKAILSPRSSHWRTMRAASRGSWRGKSGGLNCGRVSVFQVFTQTQIHLPLLFHPLDQRFKLGGQIRLLVGKGSELWCMYLRLIYRPLLQKKQHSPVKILGNLVATGRTGPPP